MSSTPENDRHPPDPTAIGNSPTTSTEPKSCSHPKPASASNVEEFPTIIKAKRIERKAKNEELPDPPQYRGNQIIPATIENLEVILPKEGFDVRYNLDKKKVEIDGPGHTPTIDNHDNVGLTKINSVAARYGMATANISAYVDVIADKNAYSPAADWIGSKPWDGVDRLPAFYATVQAAPGYPEALKIILLYKWLLSVVAAALMRTGFRNRGVLVLQGDQGINKTSWVRALISHPLLRDQLVKLDHHLDTGNKDSILGAITHWIVEIGELESSFKKDVARLKGFLTSPTDKVRRPYAKSDSEYPRRTVFVATVNDTRFLVDSTGNSRWWTIAVTYLDADHKIDMQQLYAQLAVAFNAGEEWWLTKEEEAQLALINEQHQAVSAVDEIIRSYVDPARSDRTDNPYVTASGLLKLVGIDNPSNPQSREAGATLRQLFGDPKRVNGCYKWRFPGTLNHDETRLETPAEVAKNAAKGRWAAPLPPPPEPACSPPDSDTGY
jgi:putative DNA primase/helicase